MLQSMESTHQNNNCAKYEYPMSENEDFALQVINWYKVYLTLTMNFKVISVILSQSSCMYSKTFVVIYKPEQIIVLKYEHIPSKYELQD